MINTETLRAQVEPFLVSNWHEKATRAKYRTFISKFLDFMETSTYEEMNEEAIAEYMKPYIGTSNAVTRENRIIGFRDYVQSNQEGEQQLTMLEEPKATDGIIEKEPSKDTPTVCEVETSKVKGRPKKPESDKRKNSFSVYLSESNSEALRDLARYDRKDVSVLLAEMVEMFISKNEDILTEYRTFFKNRKQLRQ